MKSSQTTSRHSLSLGGILKAGEQVDLAGAWSHI